MYNSQSSMVSFRVAKALFIRTGTYNDMLNRPYQSAIDGMAARTFRDIVSEGTRFSPTELAVFAGSVLRPMAQVGIHDVVQIDNGWDTPRLRFMLEVVIRYHNGIEVFEILSGWTNHTGVVQRGDNAAFDPNMRLVFNSSVTVKRTMMATHYGNVPVTSMSNSAHIIPRSQMDAMPMIPGSMHKTLMRPEDVLNTLCINSYGYGSMDGSETYDTRNNMTVGAKKSSRSNCLAPEYLSRTLLGLHDAHSDPRAAVDTQNNIYEKASALVKESPVAYDVFLKELSARTSFYETGGVTYAELCSIIPNLDHESLLVDHTTQAHRVATAERGQTAYWHDSSNEAIIATILAQSVPSLLMELMLTSIGFEATNRTLNGQFVVTLTGHSSFSDGMDMSSYLQAFIVRFTNEVLSSISQNNQLDLSMRVHCNVIGDTWIQISFMGQSPIDYVAPSFSDAMFSPVIASGTRQINELAGGISALYNDAIVSTTPSYIQAQDNYGQSPSYSQPSVYENPTVGAFSNDSDSNFI